MFAQHSPVQTEVRQIRLVSSLATLSIVGCGPPQPTNTLDADKGGIAEEISLECFDATSDEHCRRSLDYAMSARPEMFPFRSRIELPRALGKSDYCLKLARRVEQRGLVIREKGCDRNRWFIRTTTRLVGQAERFYIVGAELTFNTTDSIVRAISYAYRVERPYRNAPAALTSDPLASEIYRDLTDILERKQ